MAKTETWTQRTRQFALLSALTSTSYKILLFILSHLEVHALLIMTHKKISSVKKLPLEGTCLWDIRAVKIYIIICFQCLYAYFQAIKLAISISDSPP
jgi:hypothetical protein